MDVKQYFNQLLISATRRGSEVITAVEPLIITALYQSVYNYNYTPSPVSVSLQLQLHTQFCISQSTITITHPVLYQSVYNYNYTPSPVSVSLQLQLHTQLSISQSTITITHHLPYHYHLMLIFSHGVGRHSEEKRETSFISCYSCTSFSTHKAPLCWSECMVGLSNCCTLSYAGNSIPCHTGERAGYVTPAGVGVYLTQLSAD